MFARRASCDENVHNNGIMECWNDGMVKSVEHVVKNIIRNWESLSLSESSTLKQYSKIPVFQHSRAKFLVRSYLFTSLQITSLIC